ncbi:hypothetical protein KKB18_09710 [bacterium]|nr:hypothetical protein [bacterium]
MDCQATALLLSGSSNNPHIMFDLSLEPHKDYYTIGDNIKLLLDIETAPVEQKADIYFVMLNPQNKIYFGMEWNDVVNSWITGFTLPSELSLNEVTLLNIIIPNEKPPIEKSGTYTFAFVAFVPGTIDFISNLSTISFDVE